MAARASTTITLTIIARRSCRALNVGEGRNATLFRPLECGAEAALDTEAALHRAEAGKQSSPSVLLPRDGLEAISPPPSPSSLPAAFLATQRLLHPLVHLSSLQQRLPSKKTGQGTWRENASKKSVVRAIGAAAACLSFFPRQESQDKEGRKKA